MGSSLRAIAAFAFASVIFFAVGAADLSVPGLMYDEAADAVPAMNLLAGKRADIARNIDVGGRSFPAMMLDHIGPTSIYTSAIGFALFGVSVETLRLTQLAVGWLALLLLWQLAKQWFGAPVAAAAVLLCGSAPAFIWWSRAGANYTVPLLVFALGMLLALTHFWRTGSRCAAILGAFLFGAGVMTKILFVWLLAPLMLTAFFARQHVIQRAKSTGAPLLLACAAASALGAAPLIYHNIPELNTLRFITGNAAQTRLYGHNNLDFGNNLLKVLGEFARMMGGDIFSADAPARVPAGAVAIALALAVSLALWRKQRTLRLPHLFLTLTVCVVLPLSTVSTSSIGATYVFIIVPLAWLLIAVATAVLRPPIQPIVLGLIVLANVAANIGIVRWFEQTGGHGQWSSAVNDAAKTLQRDYAGRPVYAMDWGFRRNINLLTNDTVEPLEAFEYAPQPSQIFRDQATVLLRDPRNVYLFHSPAYTQFAGRDRAFERVAQMQHLALTREHIFLTKDGQPAIYVVSAKPAPPGTDIAPELTGRNAVFASGVTLLGGSVAYDVASNEIAVKLQWQSSADALKNDTVLLHLIDQSTGALIANGDHQPVYGNHTFDRWQRGEVVIDAYWFTLSQPLPPGVYQIRVGIYDRATQARFAIADPQNDAGGNSLMLRAFEVK